MHEVKVLFGKELHQMLRNRGALWTALLLPLLFLLIGPAVYMLMLMMVPAPALDLPRDLPVVDQFSSPHMLLRRLILPLFMLVGGLLVPSTTATYTLIAEREQRTLELLVGLPVRIGQVLLAKLLAVDTLTFSVCMLLFAADASLILLLGIGAVGYVALLGGLLLAALAYSTTSALLIALLARDLRAANNLATVLLVPIILFGTVVLVVIPGAALALLLLIGLLLTAAAMTLWIALRVVTFERLLR
jgi:ABC-type Na+ efflux pump permease subunit